MKEIRHNTPAQVQVAITEALEALDACDVPDDLRVAAFTFAAQQAATKQIFYHPSDQNPTVMPAMAIPGTRH